MNAPRPPSAYRTAAQEDRCAARSSIMIPAMLRASGGRSFQTSLCDLSLAGFAASSINRMHTGSICWLSLPGLESLQAEVIWWNNGLVGCGFTTLLSPVVYDNLIDRWRASDPFQPL
jgi:hypothetical protein